MVARFIHAATRTEIVDPVYRLRRALSSIHCAHIRHNGAAESDSGTTVGIASALAIAVKTPICATEIRCKSTLPGPTAQHVSTGGGRFALRNPTWRAHIVAYRRGMTPLPHVAGHIADTIRAHIVRARSDRLRRHGIRGIAAVVRHPDVSPRPVVAIRTACRLLPLGFRWDGGLRPVRVMVDVLPAHVHHRVVFLPSPLRSSRHPPRGCLTARPELGDRDRETVDPVPGERHQTLWLLMDKPIGTPVRVLLGDDGNIGIAGPHQKVTRGDPHHVGVIKCIAAYRRCCC